MCRRPSGGTGSIWRRAIKPLAHFLAGLEERHALLIDRNVLASARVAGGPRRTFLDREFAKPAQLDAIAPRHRGDDLIEKGVDDVFDFALIQMRSLRRYVLCE